MTESRTRPIVLFAFGGLLALLAAAGAAGIFTLQRLHQRESELRAAMLQSARAMERLRDGIYLSGIYARDYFITPSDESLLQQLAQLKAATYTAIDSSRGLPHVASLRGEIDAYWRVLDLMAGMAREGKGPAVDAFFRSQLSQRRSNMLQIAGSLAAAGETELARHAAELERTHRVLQVSAIAVLLLTLAAGGAIAFAAMRRMTALEHARTALSTRLAQAQEEERKAIARELHDGAGQTLSALLIDAADPSRLDAVRRLAEQALESVRGIALALRPSMLDDLGLVPALEWQAREASRRSGIPAVVETSGDLNALSDELRTCVYRIAQEALYNACRHASPKHIRIHAAASRGTVELRVEDDGVGFVSPKTRGLGLLGMEERARRLGGTFTLRSAPGSGTTVTVRLPEAA